MVTFKSPECFNWGAEDRLEMFKLRSIYCFNCGAENMVEMVALRNLE